MQRVLKAEEMRGCDQHAIDVLGIPGVVLMENAGRASAEEALSLLAEHGGRRAVVYCGGGNNGGDGFVVARWLHERGVPVSLVLGKDMEDLRGDAEVNARIADRLRIPVEPRGDKGPLSKLQPGDVVVDALLGTGLRREVTGLIASLIDEVNLLRDRGCAILALDVPSGVNSDSGLVMGRAVRADSTVTFGYLKRGLILHPGAVLAGKVAVADIGLPSEVESTLESPPCHLLTDEGIKALLPVVSSDAHKGTFGHVLVVAGCPERPGAAALVCHGSLRAGAGLTTLATRKGGEVSLSATLPEAMGIVLPGDGPLGLADLSGLLDAATGKSVIAVGPGISRGPETGALIENLARETGLPMVVDADGINALEGRTDALAGISNAPVVLTPHPLEMARLIQRDVSFVQADRLGVASKLARESGTHLVLKGAGTIVADPDGAIAVCDRGGPALATGGTGDVLTGVIAALLASGMPAGDACRVGVFVHAVAGEGAGARSGRAGSIAGDVALELCEVWRDLEW